MIRRRHSASVFWILISLVLTALGGLTGCLGESDPISPDDLGPGELMVAATLPGSAELQLGRSLGLRLVAGGAYRDSTFALDAEAAASLEPDLPGRWIWGDGGHLMFHPEIPYNPNTRYRVTLDPEAFKGAGLVLRGSRQFDFTADPFRLESMNLVRTRVGYQPPQHQIEGTLVFNYPVDPEQALAHLSAGLEDLGPVELVMESTGTAERLRFRSAVFGSDQQDRRFRVRLAGELRPAMGGDDLGKSQENTTLVPAIERLRIHEVSTDSENGDHRIIFRFSESVLPEDLRHHLKVEPEVANLRLTGHWQQVRLTGDFKTGESYTFKVHGGLAAENGMVLENDFTRRVTLQDLEPMVRISGPGNYLSLRGEAQVGVETINLEKFGLVVQRIYPNNLVPFLQKVSMRFHRDRYYGWNLNNLGTTIAREEVAVAPGGVNSLQVTPVDLGEILDRDSRGIFRLQVHDPDEANHRGDRRDGRWLVATDLGLVAKRSGGRVEVAVASISKLIPVPGVTIKVLSRNNQELASARSDDQGLASFSGLSSDQPGDEPFVVVATLGDDLSFLAFGETAIRTADLDVGGIDLPEKGYRAFLYGDRDIYRPGETLHLAWMVRDANLQPAPDFPLNLRILGPGGEEFAVVRTESDEAGCGEYNALIPTWARTGRYTALLFLGEDRPLGEARFSVEDFMPDRMKVTSRLEIEGSAPPVVGPGATLELSAEAMSLFGPPAADRPAEATIWFRHAEVELPGYEDFRFGEDPVDELPPRRNLGKITTDPEGQAAWDVPLPEASGYQGWLRVTALVQISELGGGRAVSSTAEIPYSPRDRVIGMRSLDEDGSDYREAGQPVAFEAVMLDLQGQPVPDTQAVVKLMRRQWRTVLKRDGHGEFHYVSEYDEKLAQERDLSLTAGPTRLEVTPDSHGSYRLVVQSGDGEVRGSIDFYVYGHGYSPWAMSNPEKVNLKLDRESYGAGDEVTASVEAPFPGLMLLTIEREKVFTRKWVRLTENTGTVKIRLPREAAPNVYLTATLLRPLDELDPRSPARAFGAQPVFVDREPRILPLEMATVQEMRPRRPLTVRLKLPQDADPMRLTVAAVDEGILQLTDFETPSAVDHFLARRRLGVNSHDIWSLLLPEFERVKRKSASGGGMERSMAAPPDMAKRLNPLSADRVKPVALWSGLVEGRPGWQEITFDVPEFNGTLRIMAVATAGDRFGVAEAQVRVADPLVLSPSLPRFLAPGDRFALPVPVYNGLPGQTGSSADVTLGLDLEGPIKVVDGTAESRSLQIAQGREEALWFDLEAAAQVGVARVRVNAAAAGELVSVETELPVRPAQALDSRVSSGSLRDDEVTVSVGEGWLPGTAVTAVSVSANPAAAFGASLPYLLRYPYGCLEQKTSRCFPLIHFGDLAATLAPGEFGDQDGDYFVNSGLDYLATLYRPGMGFVMWPGAGYDSRNPFATVYATHFLVEARDGGYVVPEHILEDALRVVAGFARSGQDGWPNRWTRSHRHTTRAYACYVLARAGQPERGAMDQLTQDAWEQLSAASRTHLAGAYALTGNRSRFDQMLPAADAPVEAGRSSGFTWYSLARDEAMRLEVLATVDPDHPQVPRLLQRLSGRAENGRWYNTQENAFALLALGKLARGGRLEPAVGRVLVDGREVGSFDGEDLSLVSRQWAGKQVRIISEGAGTAWYSILDEGVPPRPRHEQHDAGLVVRRDYLDREGQPVDPAAITLGQTIVCRLLLQSDKGTVEDIVLSDLVPAGLEIENPRLGRDGSHDWIGKEDLKKYRRLSVDHLEIRDDRLLLFTRAEAKVGVFHYTLRAVTAGRFALPQVRAEAMYDPEVMSTRGGGEIRVVRP